MFAKSTLIQYCYQIAVLLAVLQQASVLGLENNKTNQKSTNVGTQKLNFNYNNLKIKQKFGNDYFLLQNYMNKPNNNKPLVKHKIALKNELKSNKFIRINDPSEVTTVHDRALLRQPSKHKFNSQLTTKNSLGKATFSEHQETKTATGCRAQLTNQINADKKQNKAKALSRLSASANEAERKATGQLFRLNRKASTVRLDAEYTATKHNTRKKRNVIPTSRHLLNWVKYSRTKHINANIDDQTNNNDDVVVSNTEHLAKHEIPGYPPYSDLEKQDEMRRRWLSTVESVDRKVNVNDNKTLQQMQTIEEMKRSYLEKKRKFEKTRNGKMDEI